MREVNKLLILIKVIRLSEPKEVKYKTTHLQIEQAKANLGFRVLYSESKDQ